MNASTPTWFLLIVSLPANGATARMRVWRAVKALGCVALRDGAYLLPRSDARAAEISELAADVHREGGTAWVLDVAPHADGEQEAFIALFDRSDDYAPLLKTLAGLRGAMPAMNAQDLNKLVRKLRKEYEAVHAIDFFPGDAAMRASQAWEDFMSRAESLTSGEPQASAGQLALRNAADYRGRTWATRKRPWVDRVASAWLIRRFIDPEARILWLETPAGCPPDALGFDFDGAAFTHVGELVTFEVLMASFGLAGDSGLAQLARLVHFLDVGGRPVAAAGGFEAMLDGARRRTSDDDQLLAEMSLTLDSLYVHYLRSKGDNIER